MSECPHACPAPAPVLPQATSRDKRTPRYQRKSPARDPRPNEIDLLIRLAEGPQPVREGPVGRCLKKGWLMRVAQENEDTKAKGGEVLYGITPDGLALLSCRAS